ncbi:MAG TPA: rhomboid family intramembrane serine protease [Enhygromyxa sp.]|nr:rhomboid family intramembrane serine protease [Enhygromyxa sp.]
MHDDEQGAIISLAERRARAEEAAAEAARRQAMQQARRADGDQLPKPWLTYVLIGLNAAVWLVMVGLGVDAFEPDAGALLTWGGNLGILTSGGEWWRLLTATFIHAGILHLAFNLYFAWVIGRACEQIFGSAAYALIYFGSGLFASLVSVAWQPGVVSVGASGALFGVFGAFLGFTIRRRGMLRPEFVQSVRRNALILIGINLAIGFAVPGIDVAAHVGGLVAGLGIGYSIAKLAEKPISSPREARAVRVRAIGLTTAATVAVLVAGALAIPRYDNPIPTLERVWQRHDDAVQNYEATQEVASRIAAIEQELLPMLREGEAELGKLERLPKQSRATVDANRRYFELQIRAFERELEALRNDDPSAMQAADELHAEAIAALE